LAINKLHDYKIKPKTVTYKIDGHFIDESTHNEFLGLLDKFKQATGAYIHRSDIMFMRQAFDEKKARDKK